MNTHIRIFIDASGSMGKMQGSTDEGKYFLPDTDDNQDPQIDDNSELNKQIGFKAEKILFEYLQKNNLDN